MTPFHGAVVRSTVLFSNYHSVLSEKAPMQSRLYIVLTVSAIAVVSFLILGQPTGLLETRGEGRTISQMAD